MKQILLALLFVILASNTSLYAQNDNPPNIIFVLIDDMGWKDMNCTGSTFYETPNIDALAEAGMRFNYGYSSSPVCAPSRGAIFSGKNPARTKFTTVFRNRNPENKASDDRLYDKSKSKDGGAKNKNFEALHTHVLPSTEVLFSEVLGDAGYKTGFFGKWHCGVHEKYTPNNRGFQTAIGYRTMHVPTNKSGHWGKTFKPFGAGLNDIEDDKYIADVLTDECINFIRENKKGPFIAVLSHYLVHLPIQAKPELVKRFENKATDDQDNPEYAAMLYSVDQSLGRVVEALKELDLEENTMIVFTSDNGGLNGSTSNYPLMGGKSFAFEAGTRVPFIVKWPKVVKAGQVTNAKAIGMDLYPTFLEVAGVPLKPEQHQDGVSLLPVLKGEKGTDRELIFHYPHYTSNTSPYSSVIEGNYKLIRFYNDGQGAHLLFDLEKDPYELNDLSEAMPKKTSELRQLLDEKLTEMGAELPYTNPEYSPEDPKLSNRVSNYQRAIDQRASKVKKLKKGGVAKVKTKKKKKKNK